MSPRPRYMDQPGGDVQCECQSCSPETHEDCSADCIVYDCNIDWACCNDRCERGVEWF